MATKSSRISRRKALKAGAAAVGGGAATTTKPVFTSSSPPCALAAVSFTVYVPGLWYVKDGFCTVESTVPLPSKSHAHEVGDPVD
jgi:hypothetical protein